MDEDWTDNPNVVEIVELTILSIIRAHPGNNDDEGKRLRTVMKSLFEINPRRGKPRERDLEELLHMANSYVSDRGENYTFGDNYKLIWLDEDIIQARSLTALAKDSIEFRKKNDSNYALHNQDEKARNLVAKFEKNRDELLILVVGWESDGATGALKNALQDVRELLRIFKIPVANLAELNRERNSPN